MLKSAFFVLILFFSNFIQLVAQDSSNRLEMERQSKVETNFIKFSSDGKILLMNNSLWDVEKGRKLIDFNEKNVLGDYFFPQSSVVEIIPEYETGIVTFALLSNSKPKFVSLNIKTGKLLDKPKVIPFVSRTVDSGEEGDSNSEFWEHALTYRDGKLSLLNLKRRLSYKQTIALSDSIWEWGNEAVEFDSKKNIEVIKGQFYKNMESKRKVYLPFDFEIQKNDALSFTQNKVAFTHSDFENGELRIGDLKTGKISLNKLDLKGYKFDLITINPVLPVVAFVDNVEGVMLFNFEKNELKKLASSSDSFINGAISAEYGKAIVIGTAGISAIDLFQIKQLGTVHWDKIVSNISKNERFNRILSSKTQILSPEKSLVWVNLEYFIFKPGAKDPSGNMKKEEVFSVQHNPFKIEKAKNDELNFSTNTSALSSNRNGYIEHTWEYKNISYSFVENEDSYNLRRNDTNENLFTKESKSLLNNVTITNSRIFWTGSNGDLNVFDIDKHQKIKLLTDSNLNRFLLINDKNYYTGDPELLRNFYFVDGLKTYGLEQFDLQYNRPDSIYAFFDNAPKDFKNLLAVVQEKRFSKMGGNITFDKNDITPELLVKTEEIRTELGTQVFPIQIIPISDLSKIARFSIYANGVPVFGMAGIVAEPKYKDGLSLLIPLVNGDNIIEVSAVSTNGLESIRQEFRVRASSKVKPKLYSLNIGVSEFADSDYNLTYAAKDAKDLEKALKNLPAFDLVPTVLTNSQVTRENIEAFRDKIKDSKPEDIVLISIASHGVMDEKFNYYLAGYQTDFENPEKTAIPFEVFENLMDGIPAQKKVFLIDACHSGEALVDENGAAFTTTVQKTSKNNLPELKTRAFKSKKQKTRFTSAEVQQLLDRLYPDIRRKTGAIIISASGAREFALESDSWNNGVFTYAVINGLNNKSTDRNKDGKISIRELKEYIYREVPKLTNGQQNPTTRIDNLRMDFVIK